MFSRAILQRREWHAAISLMMVVALLPVVGVAASQTPRGARASALSPEVAQRTIAERARTAVDALRRRDMRQLTRLVHPTRGVRFSPYPSVSSSDAVLMRAELATAWRAPRPDVWGETEAGEINLTFQQYFSEYVYDRDFARIGQVSYNRPRNHGNNRNMLRENYPRAILVQYHVPGRDSGADGMDWKSLWLVFERRGSEWFIVGIAHDEWGI